MTDTNQGSATESTEGTQVERTFTQDEVNKIVSSRLKDVQSKYTDYDELKAKASKLDELEEASKTELQKVTERANALQEQIDALNKANTVREARMKVSKETNVPFELLTADTEEACQKQAESILAFAKPQSYPTVKDGGEAIKKGGGTAKEQFADWFNSAISK